MAKQATAGPVEFTPEAERTVQERTSAFGEELRLAAIDEAIRRRGSASEVNASDVLRAAASALEQESVKAYEQKIDALASMLEEQSVRSQMNATELTHALVGRVEALAGTVGMTKEREKELQEMYQKLQQQSFASASELRHVLERELHMLRYSLEERSRIDNAADRSSDRLNRFAWLYVALGLIVTVFSLITFYLPTLLRSTDPRLHTFGLFAITGLGVAIAGVLVLAYDRLRRLFRLYDTRLYDTRSEIHLRSRVPK